MNHAFHINGSLEVHKHGEVFLTEKRILLLQLVEQTGSISAASKALKMSYQQAWHFIKEMNELAPIPLVKRQRGGSNGGGAELTSFGQKMIEEYNRLLAAFMEFQNEETNKLGLCFF